MSRSRCCGSAWCSTFNPNPNPNPIPDPSPNPNPNSSPNPNPDQVLQSKEFWQFAAPLFHEAFPFTAEASAADFYKTYNRVSPGCIRVEADEVTYPLHVILRYDIERRLFRGEMSVDEVPGYWV